MKNYDSMCWGWIGVVGFCKLGNLGFVFFCGLDLFDLL